MIPCLDKRTHVQQQKRPVCPSASCHLIPVRGARGQVSRLRLMCRIFSQNQTHRSSGLLRGTEGARDYPPATDRGSFITPLKYARPAWSALNRPSSSTKESTAAGSTVRVMITDWALPAKS